MTSTPTAPRPPLTRTVPMRPAVVHEPVATPRPLTIALADDCEVVSVGLARMLQPYAARVRVVPGRNEVPDASPDHPQLVLFDCFPSPPVDGAVRARLTTLAPAHDLVVWTWEMRPELVESALERGFRGYLSKKMPAEQLLTALERIRAGEVVVAPARVRRAEGDEVVVHWPGHNARLTPREADVVALVTHGASNQDIAEHLYLSINSVKSYIRSAYRKMEVTSRAQAMLWGIEHGFLTRTPDDELTTRTGTDDDG